jgi:hypothetical protein
VEWTLLKGAWEAEEPLIQKELAKPEPRKFPWIPLLIIGGVLSFVASPICMLGVPLAWWLFGGTHLWQTAGNTKHSIHLSLLANNTQDVRWLLKLTLADIVALSSIQALVAERRIAQLKATFQERIKELTAIGASGELAAKVSARAQQYSAALTEADIMEKAIQAVVQNHKSNREALEQDAKQGMAYQTFLKATADAEAATKAHGLGVIDSKAVITANANLLNAKSAAICSSIGCGQPKVKDSACCVAHTCGNDQCSHPSGAAVLKSGDGANKKMVATAVHVGGKWAGTEEPAFNLSLDNAFCAACVNALYEHRDNQPASLSKL